MKKKLTYALLALASCLFVSGLFLSAQGVTAESEATKQVVTASTFGHASNIVSFIEPDATGYATPPPGMVAWYPRENNTNDIQGGNNGKLQNGTTFTLGMVAKAFRLDGVNDNMRINSSGFLKGQSAATAERGDRPLSPAFAGLIGYAQVPHAHAWGFTQSSPSRTEMRAGGVF